MATHLNYDTGSRIIYVTTAPTAEQLTLNVQKDIYSAVKLDWKNVSDLDKQKMPFQPQGGFVITPGKTLTPYYILREGWTMRPYEADHTLYLEEAVLLGYGGADPWIPTIGNYTVNIRDAIPSDARTLETGVSGLTAQESTDLSNIASSQVTIQSSIVTIQSSIGSISVDIAGIESTQEQLDAELRRALGLMQENFSMDQQSYSEYQGQSLLVSARMRLYNSPNNVGSDAGVIATYLVTAAWTGQENILYNVKRVFASTTTTTSTTSTTTT